MREQTGLPADLTSGKISLQEEGDMNEEKVLTGLIEILKECQNVCGHDDGDSITGDTVPHGGLKGFQSDVTPTLVCRLARRLGEPLGDDVDPENIFASPDKQKKLTVKEAAKRFLHLYGSKGDK
jgi:hypothetical protein